MADEKLSSEEPVAVEQKEYETPLVEEIVTASTLEREVAYAGTPSRAPG